MDFDDPTSMLPLRLFVPQKSRHISSGAVKKEPKILFKKKYPFGIYIMFLKPFKKELKGEKKTWMPFFGGLRQGAQICHNWISSLCRHIQMNVRQYQEPSDLPVLPIQHATNIRSSTPPRTDRHLISRSMSVGFQPKIMGGNGTPQIIPFGTIGFGFPLFSPSILGGKKSTYFWKYPDDGQTNLDFSKKETYLAAVSMTG